MPPADPHAAYRSEYHERDYIERTIETVRNHQHADNCWPQWANIFADEIERLWAENERLHKRQLRLMELVSHGDE